MKRFLALFLALAMGFSLCACDYLPEEVKQEAANVFDEAMDQSKEAIKDTFDEYKDVLKDEIKNRFKDYLGSAPEDMKGALNDKLQEIGADALTEPQALTFNVLGNEYASLLNFPNAKIMAVLHEYPIGGKFPDPSGETYTTFKLTIDGETVSMGSMQCMAYARYIQFKLYGKTDYTSGKDFYNVLKDFTGSGNVPGGTLTKDLLKEVITAAGPGAHIRTETTMLRNKYGELVESSRHSMFVVQVDDEGFTILDANSDNEMTIRMQYFTWQDYMDDIYAIRGLKFVNVYRPTE